MAKGMVSIEDKNILNQCSSGLGNNKMGKVIYKIKSRGSAMPTVISPVFQGLKINENNEMPFGGIKQLSCEFLEGISWNAP